MKSAYLFLGLLLMLMSIGAPLPAHSQPQTTLYIRRALSDPLRPAAQVSLDRARKPGETVAFSGLKPGDQVADVMPGNAYFTRIFSRVVGPRGHVYAFLPAEQLAHCSPDEISGTLAIEHDHSYSNVTVLRAPAENLAAPVSLDMVWLSQGYHDLHNRFMQPSRAGQFNVAVFRALKKGGVYLIIDHVASAGSGLRDTEALHRIDPSAIASEVTAAGFVLEAQSEALRNPEDAHKLPVLDPAVRYRTDQVVLKFRKP